MSGDDTPELYAAILTLRAPAGGAVPAHAGRAVQGWWLDHVRRADPDLATRLHEASERRPYSCSALEGLPPAAPGALVAVTPDRAYRVRLAAWEPGTVARLRALVADPPPGLTLGATPFAIERTAPDPATPPATFAALAAAHLAPPERRDARPPDVTLRFLTATSFRQAATPAGRPAPLPFPLPALVWPGLFDRWQEASPVRLEPGAREALAARVAVGRFAGESQRVLVAGLGDPARQAGAGAGRWVVGYVGRCTYWWPREDGYLGGILHLLAAFARLQHDDVNGIEGLYLKPISFNLHPASHRVTTSS